MKELNTLSYLYLEAYYPHKIHLDFEKGENALFSWECYVPSNMPLTEDNYVLILESEDIYKTEKDAENDFHKQIKKIIKPKRIFWNCDTKDSTKKYQ
jgi:hypothetical protein